MCNPRSFFLTLFYVLCLVSFSVAKADRTFVHPGITYTQADIDRMRAMIAAKQEPFYSTYIMLKTSSYASTRGTVSDRGEQIKEGQFNYTVGIDGRRAHDLALIYVLSGEKKYADKAVEYLNANSHYTNTSNRGTSPLDNGKVNLLIEAAELLRDYPGWEAADQQRFKDMLVYPYYSTTKNLASELGSIDDSKNGITFYWNCFNFDAGRFGNQGLFAARALLAMGVYLDNDVIFDRAYQYLIGTQDVHFQNYTDLPYVAGPRTPKTSYSSVTQYLINANGTNNMSTIANYGYDEQLQYYFFKNGQSQEACRDQGHNMCGVEMYTHLAEQCWNQGEDLYGALDNRILKAIEYNTRINMTCLTDYDKYLSDRDWDSPWRPSSYSVTGTKPTADWAPATSYDNNPEPDDPSVFYQTWSRSARWFYKDVSEDGGDKLGSSGCRETGYAHYHIRMGIPEKDMEWLTRDRQYLLNKYKYENWGMDTGHYYEWCGWGTLTKTRLEWMVGDPVHHVDGQRVMGIHQTGQDVLCADFDFFSAYGNGRTYFKQNIASNISHDYRPDGDVEIEEADGAFAVMGMTAGEWLTYTYNIPTNDTYQVAIRYATSTDASVIVSVDNVEVATIPLASTQGQYQTVTSSLGNLSMGAHVVRLTVQGEGSVVSLSRLKISDQTTAINSPRISETGLSAYSLQGFRADATNKGILIVDGHKKVNQ